MKFLRPITFLSILTILFYSCDNEPLEGEFILEDPDLLIASFQAEVEDVTFVADSSGATTIQGVTTITGLRSNGDLITIVINDSGVGNYSLVSQGEGIFGISVEPFAFSSNNLNGQGQVTVTKYDIDNEIISGTFSFIATRPRLDNNGNPILDGNGNPIFDSVIITEGIFNNIPLDSDGTSGGGSTVIPKLLTRYTDTGSVNQTYEFEYNQQNKIEKITVTSEDFVYEGYYFYDGSGFVNRLEFHYNGIYSGDFLEFSNNGQRITERRAFSNFDEPGERYEYLYTGIRITQIRYFALGDEELTERYLLFYDGPGNVMQYTIDDPLGTENDYRYSFVYDDKNHPFKNFDPAIVLIDEIFSVRNNPVKREYLNFPFEEVINTLDYSYNYDADDYPVMSTETLDGVLVRTLTYEYNQ